MTKLSQYARLLPALVCASALPLGALGSTAAAQPLASSAPAGLLADDDDLPDRRDEVKELIDTLDDHAGARRGAEDDQAIGVIDQLYQEFPNSGPRDRASIVKALEKVFKERRRPNEDGTPNNQLFLAAATAMRDMGPESVRPLIKLIGHKDHDDDLVLQRRIVLSLGNTQDEDGVDPLSDLLQHHSPTMQAAAAEALGEYTNLESDERKDIFEQLLLAVMQVQSIVDTEPDNIIERERYDTIAGPIITSLQRLSNHDLRNPHEWQSWWNDNKRRDWDED